MSFRTTKTKSGGECAKALRCVNATNPRQTFPIRDNSRNSRKSPAFLLLCSLCVLLLNTGCSVTRGTRTPDGSLTVSNWRFLWRSEAVRFETNSTNFNARLVIGKSASDDAAVGAVVEGVVKGVTHL